MSAKYWHFVHSLSAVIEPPVSVSGREKKEKPVIATGL